MSVDMKSERYLYVTPEGFSNLVLSASEDVLTEVSFVQDEAQAGLAEGLDRREASGAIGLAVKWLDIYFAGGRPDFLPPYRLLKATPFRQQVMDLLLEIPYGRTVTYGELARRLAEKNGKQGSARAIGRAVGWNPIGVIIPCHRVLGADGRLTGYAGGIANKVALLRLENVQEYHE